MTDTIEVEPNQSLKIERKKSYRVGQDDEARKRQPTGSNQL